ncbi:ATP-grasp domain-containing protein [Halalkalibacter okhensis]|uniref:Biotin carboxylase n=1 Tax=Halalkalibacter okhensis TaxID=333138 RepID=A0A0B0IF33_9BACI|nr:ATP-grasp domain-containing protein [Halalkalibacter okhensis]KHF39870.1 biotin carboxylase [Halalkalibacter okhensis]
MKTIVFIETNKSGSSREAIKAAERLGYLTVLLTKRKRYLAQRTEFPDVHQMYYVKNLESKLLKNKINFLQTQGKEVVAVVSFIDPFVQVAVQLSSELSRNEYINLNAVAEMEDKILTRQALEGLALSPVYTVVDQSDLRIGEILETPICFPLIVKAPVSTGSKDVLFVEGPLQLETAVQSLTIKERNQRVLIEEYLDGPQYLVEVMVQKGVAHLVAVIEQEISRNNRFIVTGYGVLAMVSKEMKQSLKKVAQFIVSTFEVENGTFHLELKRVNKQWKIIEINPRISGGVMNRLIQAAFGMNLVEETIKLYTGQQVSFRKSQLKFAYAQYLTVQTKGRLKKVTGKQRALRHEGVEEVYIKPRKGAFMTPPFSMGHRYGYVLASAYTLSEAKNIAQNAAKEIQFHLQPV